MAHLVDTSVLSRLANYQDILHTSASRAIMELHSRGETLYITPQVLIEFRNVATRSTSLNGLGLNMVDAEAKAAIFEATFPLLEETPEIYPTWKHIVEALGIVGKQVHDARLVAVCHVHRVSHVLTFNVRHFNRMASFGPGVIVVDPQSV